MTLGAGGTGYCDLRGQATVTLGDRPCYCDLNGVGLGLRL